MVKWREDRSGSTDITGIRKQEEKAGKRRRWKS
jgi:hypothetical protein